MSIVNNAFVSVWIEPVCTQPDEHPAGKECACRHQRVAIVEVPDTGVESTNEHNGVRRFLLLNKSRKQAVGGNFRGFQLAKGDFYLLQEDSPVIRLRKLE